MCNEMCNIIFKANLVKRAETKESIKASQKQPFIKSEKQSQSTASQE